jgi:hypothetical protein
MGFPAHLNSFPLAVAASQPIAARSTYYPDPFFCTQGRLKGSVQHGYMEWNELSPESVLLLAL